MSEKQAPANAFLLADGRIEVGDNGEDAKSHPFKMLARSAEAIDHWYFGRVVHDFSGMSTPGGKSRVVIDLNHDDSIQLGYASNFEVNEEGLWLSGALTPSKYDKENNAERIAELSKKGVPYEGSINFSGSATLEEIPEGQTTTANGREFSGPVTVVRKWILRSAAICPSGQDPNTHTAVLSNAPMVTYSLITESEADMPKESDGRDAFTAAIQLPETDAPVVEATDDDVAVAVEAEPVADESGEELETVAETATDDGSVDSPVEASTLSVNEAQELLRDLGPEALASYVSGKTASEVRSEFTISIRKERDELKAKLAKLESGGKPAEFTDPGVGKNLTETLPIRVVKR